MRTIIVVLLLSMMIFAALFDEVTAGGYMRKKHIRNELTGGTRIEKRSIDRMATYSPRPEPTPYKLNKAKFSFL